MKIYEGSSEETLSQGLWRRPHTSTPDRGSNTVIAGHRLPPIGQTTSLYNLDKVKLGDKISVDWKQQKYTYEVIDIHTVAPEDVAVELPTNDNRLTIYTCTPLFTYTDRLVISAILID